MHAAPALTSIGPLRRALLPALSGQGRPDHVALTFDDGPDPQSTPAFTELLHDRVRATFFLLGHMVSRATSLTRELVAAGHEVAVHGWHHAAAAPCCCTTPTAPPRPGAWRTTLAALPRLIDDVSDEGWRLGTLADHGLQSGVGLGR